MTEEKIAALEALLGQAKAAHAEYEAAELNGVYDEAWPRWYAEYLVEHDIGALVRRQVSADELADFLASSWQDSQAADPPPADEWSLYTARRIAAEF